MVCSTACSSSAKVFACAERYIAAGLCDAAVVGGVDSLCLTTLYGFHSLELVSSSPCRPADENRDGLSLGEAAGFTLLMRPEDDDRGRRAAPRLRGEQRRLPHVQSASARRGCASGHGSRTATRRAGCRCHRLRQPARHRDTLQRPCRSHCRARSVRSTGPVQLHQGLDRAHPRRSRHHRSSDFSALYPATGSRRAASIRAVPIRLFPVASPFATATPHLASC